MSFDFSDLHVFVSGGSSGINLGIAEAFAGAGARLSLMSRSAGKVEAAAARLRGLGAEAAGYSADVRQPDAVQAALAAAHTRFGDIDVLVSGAAGNFLATALGMSPNGFKTVVDIDLLGSFNVLRLSHPFLRKPGACLISLSASQAFVPTPFQAHVCAAKSGVDMLTRVLALEWGPEGIRINSIVPGPVADTEGLSRLAPTPETLEAMARRVPLRRLGSRADIANLAMVLASPLGEWITGAVIPVDGGISLTGPRDFAAAAEAAAAGRSAA
ncbi:MAG: SDR family oxidoreductase [Burkholderiaceae bacterium]|nr:SDR family oxidoreductase [Burkholderiaceae bacterium]